jgi:hypothetical protein
MKPEERFDEHLNGRDEIVVTPNMAEFMRDHSSQLRRRQFVADAVGQHQDRS